MFNFCCCCHLYPSSVKPPPVTLTAARAALKEDDFPSLSAVAVASPMTPAYSAQPKKNSSFQEEDFPALVSKIRPLKHAAGTNSAWSNHTAVAKPTSQPPPSSRPTPPLSSAPSGPQLLSSSNSSSSRRKKKVGDNGKAATTRSPPSSDDDNTGLTQQQFRAVPTMLDISSLLTVKGGNSKPPTSVTSNPSNPTPNPEPPTSKASKKKKQQKNTAAPATSVSPTSGMTQTVSTISVETAAQKENVPEKKWNKPASGAVTATLTSGLANGHPEKSPPVSKEPVAITPHPKADPPLEQEEEFPALMTKNPPPGTALHNIQIFLYFLFSSYIYFFLRSINITIKVSCCSSHTVFNLSGFKSSFPLKASAPAPSSALPPPPPGLGISATKPPPGFTGIPLNSNVVEPAPSAVNP